VSDPETAAPGVRAEPASHSTMVGFAEVVPAVIEVVVMVPEAPYIEQPVTDAEAPPVLVNARRQAFAFAAVRVLAPMVSVVDAAV